MTSGEQLEDRGSKVFWSKVDAQREELDSALQELNAAQEEVDRVMEEWREGKVLGRELKDRFVSASKRQSAALKRRSQIPTLYDIWFSTIGDVYDPQSDD